MSRSDWLRLVESTYGHAAADVVVELALRDSLSVQVYALVERSDDGAGDAMLAGPIGLLAPGIASQDGTLGVSGNQGSVTGTDSMEQ